MDRFARRLGFILAFVSMILALAAGGPAPAAEYLSPLALVADTEGKNLYVAEATANRVDVFDLSAGEITRSFPLPESPTGLALGPEAKSLYVTAGSAKGSVHVLNLETGETVGRIRVGHTPMAPIVSPDGQTLYVCNRFDNAIAVIDLVPKKEVARIVVKREPVAAALTPDGESLIVANHLPVGPADGEYTAATVSVIDATENAVAATIRLHNGSTALRGVCLSPDGKFAYATHILARYQLPTTQLERGWMNTNALTVIDVEKRAHVNTVLLDDVDQGAANPWGVVCTPDGKHVCVAHAGTHEISVIDRATLHDHLRQVAAGEKVSPVSQSPDDVPNDLSFLVDLRRRLALAGNSPRGLAAIGTRVYAAQYYSDSIGVIDTGPEARHRPHSLALATTQPLTVARRGEMSFHDAELCFQQWQSCASCHPDGRMDGLNWDLLNDGLGNPKNTRSLLLAHETPPAMAMGVRATAEAAVRAGIRHIQFAVRPDEDAAAIDEFLKSMKPLPSPCLVNGELSEAAKRGRTVFAEAGCARCHPAPHYTDQKMHDVATGKGREAGKAFDTPTLIEVWRTAPYLHDGRAATMKEVLTSFNLDDQHGNTSQLNERDIADLVEFILSL